VRLLIVPATDVRPTSKLGAAESGVAGKEWLNEYGSPGPVSKPLDLKIAYLPA